MQTNLLYLIAASEAPSAGGAEIAQVFLATTLISGAFGLLALAVMRHRSGKGTALARAADAAERATGVPGWASLPISVATVSLIVAAIGMYWDISIHIDQGRDAGPLANIAHYPILLGLMGIFASGWLAIFLPPKGTRPGPAPVRLSRDWYAPVGGILIFLCGGFSLAGLPPRRRLAPHLRPGRDPLGPDAPDAPWRSGDDADRPGDPAQRRPVHKGRLLRFASGGGRWRRQREGC